jgi:hypothetical protein
MRRPSTLKKPWNFEKPLCAEIGVELFYLEDRDEVDHLNLYDYNMAKNTCNSCIHKTECAEWGIYHENFGIWGGTTPLERTQIRRKRGIV